MAKLKQRMIRARFIIESQSNKKELAENLLKKSVEVIKQIEGVNVYDEHWEETELLEDSKLYSALVDLGIEAKDFETFFAVLLGFGPSAVIIEGPEKLTITAAELQNVVNDVINILHTFARANLELRLEAQKLSGLLRKILKEKEESNQ